MTEQESARMKEALRWVMDERCRQEERKAKGRFRSTCADDEMTNAEKMTVLCEEVGEVALEVLTLEERRQPRSTAGTKEALCGELAQVAAVAVAWIEFLFSCEEADNG